jgi:hypothetical protein
MGIVRLLITPFLFAIQNPPADSERVLVFEHRFTADSIQPVPVTLQTRVVYWAEVTGSGAPDVQAVDRRGRPVLVALIDSTSVPEMRRFEVHVFRNTSYGVTVAGLPPGASATLRLYHDVIETSRIAAKRERALAVGVHVAGGLHSGYRLDPTGGANPRGGSDYEACVLAETGSRFSTCIGASRQAFPDAGMNVSWLFIEERARVGTAALLAGRRTDFGLALRFSHAPSVGRRALDPSVLGVGVYVLQRLAAEHQRRGLNIFAGWQYGRLGSAPETELLNSNRVTVGLVWLP